MKIILFLFFLLPIICVAQEIDEARVEFNRFEYQKSAEIFNAIQKNKPLQVDDLKMLVYANYVSGNWLKCIDDIQLLIKNNHAEPMHYLMLADALKATKKYQDAIKAYQEYELKDPTDNVSIDIQSCSYLQTLTPIDGLIVKQVETNTNKADFCYTDLELGTIYFHEIGLDSAKIKLNKENVDFAELMLVRPFIEINNQLQIIEFPEQFDYFSITSLSKDPHSNTVIFTACGLLENHGELKSPQLYQGQIDLQNNSVNDVKLWSNSKPKEGQSCAFASYTPNESTIVFSLLKIDSKSYSDFFWSKQSEGIWSIPEEVKGVNTLGEEEYISFDHDTVYFSSTGRLGYGALDVYKGKYDSLTHSISSIIHFAEPINSTSDEYYFQDDKDTSLITSNRYGSNAEDDVWYIINEKQINFEKQTALKKKQIEDSIAFQAILSWEPPKIYYNFNTDIPNSDYTFLNQLINILNENSNINVEVVGYTDVRGTDEYNQNLSLNRAEFVKQQLFSHGIPEDRMQIRGEGKSLSSKNSNEHSSEEVHQSNRFVMISLVKK